MSTTWAPNDVPGSFSTRTLSNHSYRSSRAPALNTSATMGSRQVSRKSPYFNGLPNDGLVHKALCDACDVRIMGTRFKCRDCPDFDFCSTCVMHHEDIHIPNHTFRAIHWPKRHMSPPAAQSFRTNLVCDGCDMVIEGPSFKCLSCPNYDLCPMCEHFVDALHNGEHIFAKIRRPYKPVGTRGALLPINLYDATVTRKLRRAECETCEIANMLKCKMHLPKEREQPPPYIEVASSSEESSAHCKRCCATREEEQEDSSATKVDLLTGSSSDLLQSAISRPPLEAQLEAEAPSQQSVETQTAGQKEEMSTKEMVDVGVQPEAREMKMGVILEEVASSEESITHLSTTEESAPTEDVKAVATTVVDFVPDDEIQVQLLSEEKEELAAAESFAREENAVEQPVAEPEQLAEISESTANRDVTNEESFTGVVYTESDLDDTLSESSASGREACEEDDGFEIVDMDRL